MAEMNDKIEALYAFIETKVLTNVRELNERVKKLEEITQDMGMEYCKECKKNREDDE